MQKLFLVKGDTDLESVTEVIIVLDKLTDMRCQKEKDNEYVVYICQVDGRVGATFKTEEAAREYMKKLVMALDGDPSIIDSYTVTHCKHKKDKFIEMIDRVKKSIEEDK